MDMPADQNKKGPSTPSTPGASRWLMRFSNGGTFETTGYYTREQVEEWECSTPVRPIP